MTKLRLAGVLLGSVFALPALAQTAAAPPAAVPPAAGPVDRVGSKIVEILVRKGLLTREEAQEVYTEIKAEAADTTTLRVPYVPPSVRNAIRDEVRASVVAEARDKGWANPGVLPEFLSRFTVSGDFRLRGEGQFGRFDNAPAPDFAAINANGGLRITDQVPIVNSDVDRYRTRVRGRIALGFKVNEAFDVGFRMAAAANDDPVSTNITLGNDFRRFPLSVDRFFLRYRPVKSVAVFGGLMENPFLSTDLTYDRDLSFPGIALTVDQPIAGGVRVIANAGAFPFEELRFTTRDKYLLGGQLGLAYDTPDLKLRIAGAFYDFENIQGVRNEPDSRLNDGSVSQFFQRGNTLFNVRNDQPANQNSLLFGLASKFRVATATGRLDARITPKYWATLSGEYAVNTAFDRSIANFQLPDGTQLFSSGDTAWLVRARFGTPVIAERWDFSVGVDYRRTESDAVLDAFTDSDFGGGTTNTKGFVVRGELGLYKNVWLELALLSARSLDNPLALNNGQFDLDTAQIDLNLRF